MNAFKKLVILQLFVLAVLGYAFFSGRGSSAETILEVAPLPEADATIAERMRLTKTHGMAAYFKLNEFFDEILRNPTVASSKWRTSLSNPHAALESAIRTEVIEGSPRFRVTLTIPQREEVGVLLDAMADTFVAWRESVAEVDHEARLRAFRLQVEMMDKNLIRAATDLEDFRSLKGRDPSKELKDARKNLAKLQSELSEFEKQQAALRVKIDGTRADDDRFAPAVKELDAMNGRYTASVKERDKIAAAIVQLEIDAQPFRGRENMVEEAQKQLDLAKAELEKQRVAIAAMPAPVKVVERAVR